MTNDPTTPEGRATLRALAAEATPGERPVWKSQIMLPVRDAEWIELPTRSDAAFIAAASPEVVTALLDRIDELENALRYERDDHQETASLLHARTRRVDALRGRIVGYDGDGRPMREVEQ